MLFETAIVGAKVTCVMFEKKIIGIVIWNCYFGYNSYLCYVWRKICCYCYLKLLFWAQKLLVLCLVHNLLVLLFETAILSAKVSCVMFGKNFIGIVIWNCYFGYNSYLCNVWHNIYWYCYLKLPFLVLNLLVLLLETVRFLCTSQLCCYLKLLLLIQVTCVSFSTKFTGIVTGNSLCLAQKFTRASV